MDQIEFIECQELIELSKSAASVDEIHRLCSEASRKFGFEQFLYGGRIATSFIRPQLIIISGYRQDWWDHYTEMDYFKSDPVLYHCENNIMPLQWHQLSEKELESKLARQVMDESTEFGLNSGISFPVHTPRGEFAILSFATDDGSQEMRSYMNLVSPYLMSFAYYVHEAVMRTFRSSKDTPQANQLTAREKQCLLWAAEGKTSEETANLLFISESTVRFHLNNAARKLNVHTRRHAIARAICLGLIYPNF